jgi:two-component system, sensor histidine kinase
MAYRILMVDDNVKNLNATKGFLEAHGLEVVATQVPQQALDWIAEDEFALALLDVQMPEMSGDVLALKIREAKSPFNQSRRSHYYGQS